ncbi:hypothetical protein GQ53DRAFT_751205 [Thozetella sp. PMI_491]|nr:hypothetical protein GQ53DRAFT_751205 [Thozetella sp. PMI_491]
MASTPVMKATSCAACRLSSLRLFTGSFAPVRRPQILLRHPQPVATYSALRPSLSLRSGPAIEERREQESTPQNKDEGAAGEEGFDGPDAPDAPWYLQVEPPKHSTLLYEPPSLPEVPNDAPKVVKPLLKFVSEDLGMDNLELLDLRDLDPPAALGPDLIMLFGTSRSERHLHVSAGRLVQWLRGRGVHADADGLLGRNELKTRLRRKARKEKLLGTNGVTRGGDDGISTGWVCVNMGTIGRSVAEHTIVGPDGRTAGFGALNLGSTVVVQLLTESRREELGLERLWNGILKRSRAEQKSLAEDTQPLPAGQVATSASTTASRPSDRRSYSTSTRTSDPLASLEEMVMGNANGRANTAAINHILTNDAISKEPLMQRIQQFVELQPRHKTIRALQPRGEDKPSPFRQMFDAVARSLPPDQRPNTSMSPGRAT